MDVRVIDATRYQHLNEALQAGKAQLHEMQYAGHPKRIIKSRSLGSRTVWNCCICAEEGRPIQQRNNELLIERIRVACLVCGHVQCGLCERNGCHWEQVLRADGSKAVAAILQDPKPYDEAHPNSELNDSVVSSSALTPGPVPDDQDQEDIDLDPKAGQLEMPQPTPSQPTPSTPPQQSSAHKRRSSLKTPSTPLRPRKKVRFSDHVELRS